MTCPATKPWSRTVYGTRSGRERQVLHHCKLEDGHVDDAGRPSPHVCACSGLSNGAKMLPRQAWANLRLSA